MKNPKEFETWNGEYEKQDYEVKLEDGTIVRCWPNAGRMVSMDGTGREWAPEDEPLVRVAEPRSAFGRRRPRGAASLGMLQSMLAVSATQHVPHPPSPPHLTAEDARGEVPQRRRSPDVMERDAALLAEYELIQKKQSRLSANQRRRVVELVERMHRD